MRQTTDRLMKIGCHCGKEHISSVEEINVGKGAINSLPDYIKRYNAKKVFVLADINAYSVAGEKICDDFKKRNVAHSVYVFKDNHLEPDEAAVGSAIMHYDQECDLIVAAGSGVINDIGKILSKTTGNPYIIVATAPSMDGYASATSSMSMDGLKVSLPTRCPDVIIGDTDILKSAPLHMLKAGLGDMLAKYISICEWRIANLITGEYYCESVANMIRTALKECVDNAVGLLRRDEAAIEAVFNGLVAGGVAMAYAGVSRPASGVEHYFSHIWDMRGLEFGTSVDLHGVQCAIGTFLSLKLYEQIKTITPDKQKALDYAGKFDFEKWSSELRAFLGKGAESMIAQEEKEGKYDLQKHKARLGVITENWNQILEIINEELPDLVETENLFKLIGLPVSCEEIGIDKEILPMTFKATKDIRDKYVLSRLCWDLGIIDEMAKKI